ncbi:DUF4402 domain-containing protein [Sphingobacterium sp. KU25419]|nr:DUF4402 domain-containing protein [Sphingobacterium sp. KU25419]
MVNFNVTTVLKILITFLVTGLGSLAPQSVYGQEPPPRPLVIYVNPAQGLIFGAFFQGNSGGTVIIYPDGSRSVTGSIIQANLGFLFSPAIFEVDATPGTLISILNGPDVALSGSNGGFVLLHVGASSTGSPFITTATPPIRTQVRVGGTLTVGAPWLTPQVPIVVSFP